MAEADKVQKLNPDDVLVCSLGTTPDPIIKSIDAHQPSYVLFIVSKETRPNIEKARARLEWKGIVDSDIVMVDDPEDLNGCVLPMLKGIRKFLRDTGRPENSCLVADLTGGTKPMAASLVIAVSNLDWPSRYSYVGAQVVDGKPAREEEGGRVKKGMERIVPITNPYQATSLREIRELGRFFNASQFAACHEVAEMLVKKRSGDEFSLALVNIMAAFRLWDSFDYADALQKFKMGLGKMKRQVFSHSGQFKAQLAAWESALTRLDQVAQEFASLNPGNQKVAFDPAKGQLYLEDLVANAMRRAALKRYDDAVARLYSAVEKIVKLALARLGYDNSKIASLDCAPLELQERHAAELAERGYCQLGLWESFLLLQAVDAENPVAQAFQAHEKELKAVLDVRNHSLLGHGYSPVREATYKALLNTVLAFMGLRETELYQFPRFELDADFLE